MDTMSLCKKGQSSFVSNHSQKPKEKGGHTQISNTQNKQKFLNKLKFNCDEYSTY